MALVIETGTIVNGANSYVDVAEFDLYLTSRNLVIDKTNEEKEALLINACDELLAYEERFKGLRVDASQELSWPRQNAYVNGFLLNADIIPSELKKAQMQLAYESVTASLNTNSSGREVVEQEVPGVIKQKFKEGTASKQPRFGKVDKLLSPILKGLTLSVSR